MVLICGSFFIISKAFNMDAVTCGVGAAENLSLIHILKKYDYWFSDIVKSQKQYSNDKALYMNVLA